MESNFTIIQAAEVNASMVRQSGEPVASGSQRPAIPNASTAHNLNAIFSALEAETALNALGETVNSLIAALVEFGIIET